MNGKSHLITTSLVLIGLWIVFGLVLNKDYFTISLVIVAIPITFFPDIDLKFNALGHRNFFTHSIILWCILFYFNPSFLFILFIFVNGLHCFADCRWNSRKRIGYYTVKIFMYMAFNIHHKDADNITVWRTVWGMNGACSTLYLILNFIISIIILGVFLYIN